MIGEDNSDVATLKVLVRRLVNNNAFSIQAKGYSGCGEMLRKGAKQLSAYCSLGCTRLLVCYDSDGRPRSERVRAVQEEIVRPSGITKPCVIIVPVEELEAWILADIEAVTKIFPSWRPKRIDSPELIASPKEYLERLSRDSKKLPRYSHATHNERVASHLNLTTVYEKCPSFRELKNFMCPQIKTMARKKK